MSAIKVLTLCTGNAARSVMAGTMLAQLAEFEGLNLEIATAGTHAIEDQAASTRVRSAVAAIDSLDHLPLRTHRSHQLTEADCQWADLIVAMEADHVNYVRATHPFAADRTATMHRLVRVLPLEPEDPRQRIAAAGLGATELDVEIDVSDPLGGDQLVYNRCAEEIWALSQALIVLLG